MAMRNVVMTDEQGAKNFLARNKKIELPSFIVLLTPVLQAPIIQVILRSRVDSTTERTCGGEM